MNRPSTCLDASKAAHARQPPAVALGSGAGGGGGAQAPFGDGGGAARQAPAVGAVVEALDKQRQEVQPGVSSAEEAQQQPPAHRLVPQSALEAQGSPGENSTHAPVPGRHAVQPNEVAAALQQKPPRQAPVAHAVGDEGEQGAPGVRGEGMLEGDGEVEAEPEGEAELEGVAEIM